MKHRKLRIAWSVAWGLVAIFILPALQPASDGDGPITPPMHEKYYWYAAAALFVIAAAPWLGSRFSLRTLLVATTLVAVGLGLIVWLR